MGRYTRQMKPILLFGLFSICSSLFGYDVRIRVVDDQGKPVADANTTIDFIGYLQDSGKAYHGMTDAGGIFSASSNAQHSVYVIVSKRGYYEARVDRLPKNKNHDLFVVLPRIINPAALYVCRVNSAIPVQNEWIGYDFEAADWVTPHGKGRVVDVQFRFQNEFRGWKYSDKELEHSRRVNSQLTDREFKDYYGKWDAELEISFPSEKEGLFEETRFLAFSRLKLPHAAPEEGYVSTWRYTSKTYSPPTARDNVGFFVRSRVKLDAKGKIVSANYAKIVGDIYCAATGVLRFTYYYNPQANDRNLEFDPKRNLFAKDKPGANVSDP